MNNINLASCCYGVINLAFIIFARRFSLAFFNLSPLHPPVTVYMVVAEVVVFAVVVVAAVVVTGKVGALVEATEVAVGCSRSTLLSSFAAVLLFLSLILSCVFSWRIRTRG